MVWIASVWSKLSTSSLRSPIEKLQIMLLQNLPLLSFEQNMHDVDSSAYVCLQAFLSYKLVIDVTKFYYNCWGGCSKMMELTHTWWGFGMVRECLHHSLCPIIINQVGMPKTNTFQPKCSIDTNTQHGVPLDTNTYVIYLSSILSSMSISAYTWN